MMLRVYSRLRRAARHILPRLPFFRRRVVPVVIPDLPAVRLEASAKAALTPTECTLCGPATSATSLEPSPVALDARLRLVRCDTCGHVRLSHRPGHIEMTHSFSRDYLENCALAEYETCGSLARVGGKLVLFPFGNYRFFRPVLNSVRPFRRNGTIVDCGSGVGFLVDALQRDGWSAVGIEISPVLVACGKTSFGLDLRVTSFDSLERFTDLDAVTLVEIIEHLFDPVAVLRQVRGWLRPGGGVYITTPNFDCDDRRRAGMAWDAICADHYQYFTATTLTRALEMTGFQVRWIAETGSRGLNEPGGQTLRCIAVTK